VPDSLLQLLGVRLADNARLADWTLAFRNSSWTAGVVIAGVLGGLLICWTYVLMERRARASGLPPRPIAISCLALLRMVTITLFGLILLQPVLALTVETVIRRTLLVLVDRSGSMKMEDPRFASEDLKRAALAKNVINLEKGLGQPLPSDTGPLRSISRLDMVRAVFRHPVLRLEETLLRDFDLVISTFATGVEDVETMADTVRGETKSAWLDKLKPDAPSTALGDGIREALVRRRGQSLAGVLVITDGASNFGIPAEEGARLAREEGVPLYFYGVGITSPRDIRVASVLTRDIAFLEDELAVTVRVRATGLAGEKARLNLRLGPDLVASEELSFSDDADQVVPLRFTPKTAGEYNLTASIDPRDDEPVKENNQATHRLRVIDSKVRLLFIESSPRWEFRYAQAALLRDRRIVTKFFLFEAGGALAGGDSPYLAGLPATREEWLKYNVIVVGDVPSSAFTAEQMTILDDYVQKFGGTLLFLAGPRANPEAYRGTTFERCLPVELGGQLPPVEPPTRLTSLELTAQGRTHPVLKIAGDDQASAAAWGRFARVYTTASVAGAKPGAQVLLVDSDPGKATRAGKLPVIALHQYGLGQVLWVGTDNLWRFRKNGGESAHALLWGQMAQTLGLHHLLGGSKRVQFTSDKTSCSRGDAFAIFARVYGTDFQPIRAATVRVRVSVRSGEAGGAATPAAESEVTLRAVPEQPGMFRGEFLTSLSGVHTVRMSDSGTANGDPKADGAAQPLEVVVNEPRFESGETALAEPLLRKLAAMSNGSFFREETLFELSRSIRERADRITTTQDADLWSSPLLFALIAAMLSVEWALRKRLNLK
jgi:hypothetical protein